ncbi:MAG TPA: pitrilysin family protein [Candidatus Angelobacter sp.]|nr:pitrilysin family protein [Candidatus Angelobacter sp.]
MKKHWLRFPLVVAFVFFALALQAQDISSFEKKITVKKLANGLTIIIMERPEAPVFSFYTYVNAGAAQEVDGITGLAHMFEHMAFKGTDKIGTTNFLAEKAALAKVETAYAAYLSERLKETRPGPAKVAALEKAWKDAIEQADQYVVPEEYSEIIESQGGVGLNASTNWDNTDYVCSFPENRLQLWAYLESERFLHPVMREFYKERDVVYEERRLRTDSSPQGRLIEQFLRASFVAHPYGRPVIGWPSDLKAFSATDAINFFHKYYVPANITVTVAGDVRAAEAMPVFEKYFGRLPTLPAPEPLRTQEPAQAAERFVVLHESSQPVYVEGYHRPNFQDPDDAVYDVLADLVSKGRTSRLYRSLVRDKQIAVAAQGGSFPGGKYPNLFFFFAVPSNGHTAKDMAGPIHDEIEKLKTQDVSDEELRSVKTRAKADLIRGLADNSGLATQLGQAQALYGDWRELFRQIDRIEKVSKADIRRVANKTFSTENRTVAMIETGKPETGKPEKEKPAAPAQGEK